MPTTQNSKSFLLLKLLRNFSLEFEKYPNYEKRLSLKLGNLSLKVVDSCQIFFLKTGSDTFRGVLIYGKEQESRKKIFHNRTKNIHLSEKV